MIVQAWAPNRILDLGGWTDTWFRGGVQCPISPLISTRE
jgi:hypothetical protein